MKYTIYQIPVPTTKEEESIYCKYAFRRYESVKNDIDINRYKEVYSSEINTKEFNNIISVLEEIFKIFNLNHPKDFHGHSLSVSDIVKINDIYYYCDSFGWQEIKNIKK